MKPEINLCHLNSKLIIDTFTMVKLNEIISLIDEEEIFRKIDAPIDEILNMYSYSVSDVMKLYYKSYHLESKEIIEKREIV